MRSDRRMRDHDVARHQCRRHLSDDVQKRVVVRHENLNVIAHLGQLGRRSNKIRNRSRISVPDKDVKTLATQIIGNSASDNAQPNYTNIFLGSTSHWRLSGLFAALPPVQPAAKNAIVQSRSWTKPSLERPPIVSFRAKIDN